MSGAGMSSPQGSSYTLGDSYPPPPGGLCQGKVVSLLNNWYPAEGLPEAEKYRREALRELKDCGLLGTVAPLLTAVLEARDELCEAAVAEECLMHHCSSTFADWRACPPPVLPRTRAVLPLRA
jgi:hypothetical protein